MRWRHPKDGSVRSGCPRSTFRSSDTRGRVDVGALVPSSAISRRLGQFSGAHVFHVKHSTPTRGGRSATLHVPSRRQGSLRAAAASVRRSSEIVAIATGSAGRARLVGIPAASSDDSRARATADEASSSRVVVTSREPAKSSRDNRRRPLARAHTWRSARSKCVREALAPRRRARAVGTIRTSSRHEGLRRSSLSTTRSVGRYLAVAPSLFHVKQQVRRIRPEGELACWRAGRRPTFRACHLRRRELSRAGLQRLRSTCSALGRYRTVPRVLDVPTSWRSRPGGGPWTIRDREGTVRSAGRDLAARASLNARSRRETEKFGCFT
ncbi:hypothetical protein EDD28_1252 [Salana multivorans]|uniref:Uncharacterized protein n=1 Tax=Salana multivorans TaxID=120377 RepID=A0A3N2DA34_9MICO|nr:hypothetical protein EDD28_1252 [Salana multivorans]